MKRYCEATYQTKRRKTREVKVGKIGVGGDNPIRVQSMTNSNTRDVDATVEQILRLEQVGCEIARMTVQGNKEALACEAIKNKLLQKGCEMPLVADIHFYPPAAMKVIDFVDKVRINPGNFADRRAQFKEETYDEDSYQKELERIEEKFAPLVLKCKEQGKSMRIGTNHGSLSDRIMSMYGDSPKGMVESALEYTRICQKYDFHDLIFSMKSSNPQLMVLAYRLLVSKMYELGWDYPLHLGVTEAGDGEDGRIKSSVGISSLLLDGLGDTIRVSLTEDPWNEIDPCKRMRDFAQAAWGKGLEPFEEKSRDFERIEREKTLERPTISLHPNGSVFLRVQGQASQQELGLGSESQVDGVIAESSQQVQTLSEPTPLREALKTNLMDRFATTSSQAARLLKVTDEGEEEWKQLSKLRPEVIFLAPTKQRIHYSRKFFDFLKQEGLKTAVILNFSYDCDYDDLVIQAASEAGSLLLDGMGDGVLIEAPVSLDKLRVFSFNLLQACRMRSSKTEFISCPSCGRTLFDLQEVTQRIRERTSHLPGVKIAIMGCIVNGPGEMADADFGYVGSKAGMVDLYVGKTCVERNIDFADADDRLIALIKSEGMWQEPIRAPDLETILS